MKRIWIIGICIGFLGMGLTGCGQKEKIYQIQNSEEAQSFGYQRDSLGENDFVVFKEADTVYLLAATDSGMERASAYLEHSLLDDKGRLTLENGESYISNGSRLKDSIMIGDRPISDYKIICTSRKANKAGQELQYYIQQTSNDILEITSDADTEAPGIYLTIDEAPEAEEKQIAIQDGQVSISASNQDALKQAVYLFVNQYLGWMNAGETDARISDCKSEIHVPENIEKQDAWIEEREATIVLWNINYNRGFYLNGDTTLENSIMDLSEEQLYEYVKMLKFCGYTGIQLTEMCSAWAGAGGYEAVHEKIRSLADAAHSLDMKVTLWVWGAEFTGYGWVDSTVTYNAAEYDYAYQNPEVVATFEKYYSIYAELADCCDRLIGHFYDPGNLSQSEDIGYFSRLLRDKFYAVNPDIDFGVSCWVDVFDKSVFVRELGNDITLYECGHHDEEGDYPKFRSFVAANECRLGTWAWNTCEMEIDQLAQMSFNRDIIRSVYQTARKYDTVYETSYWSEMDSYHVLNVFSLYCAGQMLINPDIEDDVLMEQLCEAAVGEEYARALAEMLLLLQEARSGSSWDTYFWSREDYILKSDSYPAAEILEKCNQYLPVLDEMIEKKIESNTLPLPISLNQLLQMMRPHLLQIRAFAQFRMDLEELQVQYAAGADLEQLADKLYEIGTPIESYHVIEGTWGQIEARAQREMIVAFCNETGIELPVYGAYDEHRKNFIYAQFAMYQRGNKEPYEIGAPYYQYGVAYGTEETQRLVEEMVEDGLLIRTPEDKLYLANWKNYSYHFN